MDQVIQEILKHIAILNDDYSKLAISVAVLQSQMAEIMWWFRAVMGAMVVMLITQFWQIFIINKKNGK